MSLGFEPDDVRVPFQRDAFRQGDAYRRHAATVLEAEGWQVWQHRAVPEAGVIVPIVGIDRNGREFYVLTHGSKLAKHGLNGLARPDTLKKALGVAWVLSVCGTGVDIMLVTSDLPAQGTAAAEWISTATSLGLVAEVRVIKFPKRFVATPR